VPGPQLFHHAAAPVCRETVAQVQGPDALVIRVDLEVDGGTTRLAALAHHRLEECRADATATQSRLYVEFLEPGGMSALFQRPLEGDIGGGDGPAAPDGGEEEAAARIGQHTID